MEEALLKELTEVFQAIVIHSPSVFSFAGEPVSLSAPGVQETSAAASSTHPLVEQLQNYLYRYCYCRRFHGNPAQELVQPEPEDSGFLQALSAANTSTARWDPGWQIYRIEPSGQIQAHKFGKTRLVWSGEFASYDGSGMAPKPGASISIFLAKESMTLQPGFYFVFGEMVLGQKYDQNMIRFYWNIRDDGAIDLVREITQTLNHFQVPFSFKCLSNRASYFRTDAAVLFVGKRYHRITAELLIDVYPRVKKHLKPETPLFTKRLAPGLALAEEPGNGESFGMNRCRLLAEGIWNAYALQGLQSAQARLQAVTEQFGNYGIAIDRPYLNAGSVHRYELPHFQF